MRIVPIDKFDDEACSNLMQASDEQIKPHIWRLLECLQDLNWPIAGPVSERLSKLGAELVDPVVRVLSGRDQMWKYWIVSHFLYQVNDEVYGRLLFKLNSMRLNPTSDEINEDVYHAVSELLATRKCKR